MKNPKIHLVLSLTVKVSLFQRDFQFYCSPHLVVLLDWLTTHTTTAFKMSLKIWIFPSYHVLEPGVVPHRSGVMVPEGFSVLFSLPGNKFPDSLTTWDFVSNSSFMRPSRFEIHFLVSASRESKKCRPNWEMAEPPEEITKRTRENLWCDII